MSQTASCNKMQQMPATIHGRDTATVLKKDLSAALSPVGGKTEHMQGTADC